MNGEELSGLEQIGQLARDLVARPMTAEARSAADSHVLAAAKTLALVLPVAACAPMRAPAPEASVPVRVCAVVDGRLADVEGEYHPATGDTLVRGLPLTEVVLYTRAYAASADWFVRNEPIPGEPRPDAHGAYVKYGREKQMPVAALRYVAEHQGIGVYTDAGSTQRYPDLIYVPVRPGCWVQPYQYEGVGVGREGH